MTKYWERLEKDEGSVKRDGAGVTCLGGSITVKNQENSINPANINH